MARIPDRNTLGPRPTPGAPRGVPDTRGVGRGVQRAANALSRYAETAGGGLRAVAGVAEEEAERQQRSAAARATSDWRVGWRNWTSNTPRISNSTRLLTDIRATLTGSGRISKAVCGAVQADFENISAVHRSRSIAGMLAS